MDYIQYARLAQLVARRSHNPKVAGSIPALSKAKDEIDVLDGVVGNISPCHGDARGSIPRRGGGGRLLYIHLLPWLSWQSGRLLTDRSPVRARVEARCII